MSTYKYFSDDEVVGLVPSFVKKLDKARGIAGIPFTITSGKRTKKENDSVLVGAVPNSAHLKGLAVDLAVSNTKDVAKIIDACCEAGILRRGIYVDADFKPVHVHVDDDTEKVSPVIFLKREEN